MNRVIKPSSENTQANAEDDPPDSLVLKNRISKIIRQEEPDKKFGSSFFVLKEREVINIKPGFNGEVFALTWKTNRLR